MKIFVAVLLLAASLAAHAEETQERGQFYVALGRFTPASNSQLTNQEGSGALALGGGGRFLPWLSWDVDLLFADQEADTPKSFGTPGLFVSQSKRASIDTWGLGGILKANTTLGPFDLFAGVGVGYYKSTLTVTRTMPLLFNVTTQEIKRSDQGLGTQWLAGVDVRLGKHWGIGFEWRHFDFKAQFGSEVPGEVNVGGNLGLLRSRWVF